MRISTRVASNSPQNNAKGRVEKMQDNARFLPAGQIPVGGLAGVEISR
jgi:hypothetical protein